MTLNNYLQIKKSIIAWFFKHFNLTNLNFKKQIRFLKKINFMFYKNYIFFDQNIILILIISGIVFLQLSVCGTFLESPWLTIDELIKSFKHHLQTPEFIRTDPNKIYVICGYDTMNLNSCKSALKVFKYKMETEFIEHQQKIDDLSIPYEIHQRGQFYKYKPSLVEFPKIKNEIYDRSFESHKIETCFKFTRYLCRLTFKRHREQMLLNYLITDYPENEYIYI